jgi:hypothetical protein
MSNIFVRGREKLSAVKADVESVEQETEANMHSLLLMDRQVVAQPVSPPLLTYLLLMVRQMVPQLAAKLSLLTGRWFFSQMALPPPHGQASLFLCQLAFPFPHTHGQGVGSSAS